ncbi:hypothetical protein BDV93DRAFT_608253 [Ceratobasidium sp. AG-I]|nr:hypothetical protein BDV93DRAFT_608253 [Ceratobasidium sp. AG-I]
MSETKPKPGDENGMVTVDSKAKSRLYALTIGINTYRYLDHLSGAVDDANEVAKFLMQDLNVPSNHIVSLQNKSATRSAIIEAIRGLQKDRRIQTGDPILIYYAGHGGLAQASPEWQEKTGSSEIQVIFPWDYNTASGDSNEKVQCIPDRTIHSLLNDLAKEKGNNITVIFDSCHSASGSRAATIDNGIPDQIARHAEVTAEIPYNIDSDITEHRENPHLDGSQSRYPKLPLNTDQASHIHLAACGSREKAWENEKRGVFTSALLNTIRAYGADKITYRHLLTSLPTLPKQSPHCYGTNKSWILFNSLVPSRKITFIPVQRTQESWVLQAGASSGVTPGSIWELHDSPTEGSQSIDTVRARAPQMSSTVLDRENKNMAPNENLLKAERLFARQIRIGPGHELKVYFTPEAKSLIPQGYKGHNVDPANNTIEIGYVVHQNQDSAELTVSLHNREAVFTLYNPQVQAYDTAILKTCCAAEIDEVQRHLGTIARWNWHFKRMNTEILPEPAVSVEFMKLGEYHGDSFKPTTGPYVNLNKMGVVDFQARPQDEYGIKLVNHAPVPLYARVFYFGVLDFSISNMLEHSVANGLTDAEIPAKGSRLIGDEGEGGASITFGLEDGQAMEVGFIKLFWSTAKLELESLEQEGLSNSGNRGFVVVNKPPSEVENWGTEVMTLVQRA